MPEGDSDGVNGAQLARPGAERAVVVLAQHGGRRPQDPPLLWRMRQLHSQKTLTSRHAVCTLVYTVLQLPMPDAQALRR